MTRTSQHPGTRSRYVGGCRCAACREANRDYIKRWRARLTGHSAEAEHGRVSTYQNYGCRCEPCRLASCSTQREYRQRANRDVGAAK